MFSGKALRGFYFRFGCRVIKSMYSL